MSIIKGLDRIVLVLAILAMAPSFYVGYSDCQHTKRIETPEYKAYSKKQKELRAMLKAENKPKISAEKFLNTPRNIFADYSENEMKIIHELGQPVPKKYNYPSVWISALWGLLYALTSFFIILLGLCGMTRGIKWLSLWILAGFKDKKKNETS